MRKSNFVWRQLLSVCLIISMSLPVTGCATLLKGTTDNMMIHSDPPGARVSINGAYSGTTPLATTVPSDKNLQIKVEKEGYEPAVVNNDSSFRTGYEIWSFVEFVIPMLVDMGSGAAWGHDQNMVAVHLNPISNAGEQQPQARTN